MYAIKKIFEFLIIISKYIDKYLTKSILYYIILMVHVTNTKP